MTLPILIHPDEYLDAWRPAWKSAEVAGDVRYDKTFNMVSVNDPIILTAVFKEPVHA